MSEVKLPTEEELAELPRPLIVAYTVACAKRIFFFAENFFQLKELEAVRTAISVADFYSRVDADARSAAAVATAETAAARAADAARSVDAARANAHYAVETASARAADAARSAANAAAAAASAKAADAAYNAARANAHYAVEAAGNHFERLKDLAKTSTVLNIDIPIWPNGEPEWSLELKKKVAEKRLENAAPAEINMGLNFPDTMSDQDIKDFTLKMVELLDAGHKAAGGEGIVIDDVRFLRSVDSGVEV